MYCRLVISRKGWKVFQLVDGTITSLFTGLVMSSRPSDGCVDLRTTLLSLRKALSLTKEMCRLMYEWCEVPQRGFADFEVPPPHRCGGSETRMSCQDPPSRRIFFSVSERHTKAPRYLEESRSTSVTRRNYLVAFHLRIDRYNYHPVTNGILSATV